MVEVDIITITTTLIPEVIVNIVNNRVNGLNIPTPANTIKK